VPPTVASHRREQSASGWGSRQRFAAARSNTRARAVPAAAACAAVASAASLLPSPSALAAGPPTPSSVQARIATLYQQADAATQQYDGTVEQMAKLHQQISEQQSALARAQSAVNHADDVLGSVAAAQYRSGGLDETLRMMLSDQPDLFLQQLMTWRQLDGIQADTVAYADQERAAVAQLSSETREQMADLAAEQHLLDQRRTTIQTELNQAQQLLLQLTPAQQQAVNDDPTGDSLGGAVLNTALPPLSDVAATGRALLAVQAAYAQLGKPYVYGAEGPYAFDCSGLTQHVWQQAGVAIPRTSEEQAGMQTVPLSQIRPGDLVIYYGSAEHVGIYVGNGDIIHAPHPGSYVQVAPLQSMPINRVVRP
jgi:cell wall-associated NlpC family hydrolase